MKSGKKGTTEEEKDDEKEKEEEFKKLKLHTEDEKKE